MKAIDIIQDGHRALAAVLASLEFVVDGIREQRLEPDFKLLSALLDYASNMPENVLHPQEEGVFFAHVRRRCPAAAPILETLEAEHRRGQESLRALDDAFIHYQATGREGFEAFAACVQRYVELSRDHLHKVENELVPLVRRELAQDDWLAIDREFDARRGTWADQEADYGRLFSKIVNMTPAPMGVGA